jgi:hypothetical protein
MIGSSEILFKLPIIRHILFSAPHNTPQGPISPSEVRLVKWLEFWSCVEQSSAILNDDEVNTIDTTAEALLASLTARNVYERHKYVIVDSIEAISDADVHVDIPGEASSFNGKLHASSLSICHYLMFAETPLLALQDTYRNMLRKNQKYGILKHVDAWAFLMRANFEKLRIKTIKENDNSRNIIRQALRGILALVRTDGCLVETDQEWTNSIATPYQIRPAQRF